MIAMQNAKELNRQSSEETYEDVKRMIWKMARSFSERFGGDRDDYISAGNEAFVSAFCSYDPGKGSSFSTWLWWQIRAGMQREAGRGKRPRPVPLEYDGSVPDRGTGFDLGAFVNDLGHDARMVVRMLMDTPDDVVALLDAWDMPEAVRCGITVRLRKMNWSVARIAESFSEVREALS